MTDARSAIQTMNGDGSFVDYSSPRVTGISISGSPVAAVTALEALGYSVS
jgi:hypothetical protein